MTDTTAAVAAALAKHVLNEAYANHTGHETCEACGLDADWPCDAAILSAEVERLRHRIGTVADALVLSGVFPDAEIDIEVARSIASRLRHILDDADTHPATAGRGEATFPAPKPRPDMTNERLMQR